jgi:uncharacterized protein (DUF1501 family)
VLHGVGDRKPDHSHFTAMARWMAGDGSEGVGGGWLGRYLDGLGSDNPFDGVTISTSVPLAVNGQTRRATALPLKAEQSLSPVHKDDYIRRAAECVRNMGGAPSSYLGPWGDSLVAAGRRAVDLTAEVAPIYQAKMPGGRLAPQLELCARLINANFGIRVMHTELGGFDTHVDEPGAHGARMTDLDNGLTQFVATLAPQFANRVTVLTVSEFGRRVQANGSTGTDHGTASTLLAVGGGVQGGQYGAPPSLSALDRAGNLVATVDFRSVYATVLDRWLGADSNEVLGARYEDLGFLKAPTA